MHVSASVKLSDKSTSAVLADAYVTLRTDLGDISLKRFRILKGNDGNPWVALPQMEYQKDGEKKYFKTVVASKDWVSKFEEVILKAYSEAKSKK